MTEVREDELSCAIHCDMQPDRELVACESAPSDSAAIGTTSSGKRDMRAELLAWKEERVTRSSRQPSQKSRNPVFKVPPRTALSPSRTSNIHPNENAPSTCASKAQNKTTCKTPGSLARRALGERSPNICSTDCSNAPRSVSPPARQLYRPVSRVRPKTPEPSQLAPRMQTTQAPGKNPRNQSSTVVPAQRRVSPHRVPSQKLEIESKEMPPAIRINVRNAIVTASSNVDLPKALEQETTAGSSPSTAPQQSGVSLTSPGGMSPSNGGLLSAYEDKAGVPRQPPPSPATPNPAMCITLCSMATSSGVEREKTAELVRATGAALVQLTIEEPLINHIDEGQASMGTCHTEKESLTESPSRTPLDLPAPRLSLLDVSIGSANSPEPLSPLSLASSGEDQES